MEGGPERVLDGVVTKIKDGTAVVGGIAIGDLEEGLDKAGAKAGKDSKDPAGDGKIKTIGDAIHSGAMVFMHREYKMLGIFASVLALFLLIFVGFGTTLAFVIGAACSAGAGYLGMFSATKANVRTTVAAHEKGAAEALTVAFFGGSIMGLCVAALGLVGRLAWGRHGAHAAGNGRVAKGATRLEEALQPSEKRGQLAGVSS